MINKAYVRCKAHMVTMKLSMHKTAYTNHTNARQKQLTSGTILNQINSSVIYITEKTLYDVLPGPCGLELHLPFHYFVGNVTV